MIEIEQVEDALVWRDRSFPEQYTILVLGEDDLKPLSLLAAQLGDKILNQCVRKAISMTLHTIMQSFSGEEAHHVEVLGYNKGLTFLVLFARYIREVMKVPIIINLNDISSRSVSLGDFTLTRRENARATNGNGSPPMLPPKLSSLSPEVSAKQFVPHTLSPTHFGPSLGEDVSKDEEIVPAKPPKLSNGLLKPINGLLPSVKSITLEKKEPMLPQIIIPNHVPILEKTDVQAMRQLIMGTGENSLISAVNCAETWAGEHIHRVRWVDVVRLFAAADRTNNTQIRRFAVYFRCLHDSVQSHPIPSKFQTIPLADFHAISGEDFSTAIGTAAAACVQSMGPCGRARVEQA